MSGRTEQHQVQSRERFRLKFQQGLREYLARNGSAAEGFGVVWENTSRLVSLNERDQAALYWELMQWARSYEIFTSVEPRSPIVYDPGE